MASSVVMCMDIGIKLACSQYEGSERATGDWRRGARRACVERLRERHGIVFSVLHSLMYAQLHLTATRALNSAQWCEMRPSPSEVDQPSTFQAFTSD